MAEKKKKLYIKCDCCGKKIYLGDPYFKYDGYCGLYCSAECFAANYADQEEALTLAEVDNCVATLYEETVEEVTVEKTIDERQLSNEEWNALMEQKVR